VSDRNKELREAVQLGLLALSGLNRLGIAFASVKALWDATQAENREPTPEELDAFADRAQNAIDEL